MIHITESQYKAILGSFEDETFGSRGDLDTELEIIGAGLDASLNIGAVAYESRHGTAFSFYRLELLTFVDGGREVPNDFDKNTFIELYKQAS